MYIVIMGGGKVGEYLAAVMLNQGHEVAVIEEDESTADRLSIELQGQYLIIQGDGTDSDFQEDAGIAHADVFVAATGHDDDNLLACEIATRLFNVPRCIARVNNPRNRRIFNVVGIESVSSTLLIANMIEEEALMGGVGVVSALSRGDILLFEMTVPSHMRSFNAEEGVPINALNMPEGSSIAAIDRLADGEAEIATSDSILYPGDKAVVIAERDIADDVREVFTSL